MAEKDVDEQFAAIMAHWDDEALGQDPYGDPLADAPGPDDAAQRHPDALGSPDITRVSDIADIADVPSLAERPEANPPPPPPLPMTPPAGPSMRENPEGADDAGDAGDADAHYSPPPPAPLPPSEDKHFWTMMAGLVGGPLLFLYLLLFNRDGNGWWMMFALLVAIAGFVLLVLRQPLERDEGDDGIRL